jgi:hypothetical protein
MMRHLLPWSGAVRLRRTAGLQPGERAQESDSFPAAVGSLVCHASTSARLAAVIVSVDGHWQHHLT